MSLFQSNLRKQIRNLPKILNFVKIIHYYSKLFTGVLSEALLRERHALRHVEGLQLGARALGQVREVPEALEAREAELALVGEGSIS